jgi:type IV pilus assembly protein PilE
MVELMSVVAIIGILGAIAYPSYIQHVVKSKRSAAESVMYDIANKEEQYLLDARAYFCTTGGGCANALSGSSLPYTIPTNVSDNYTITVAATDTAATSTAPTYTIKATPIGAQLLKDTACGTLTLDQTNTKQISGTSSVSGCW